jgi:c-di-GMP-binding flagellar brake protein YcgR
MTYWKSAVLAAGVAILFFIPLQPAVASDFLSSVPAVSDNSQEQFLSGLNTIFSGREQNRIGWGKSAVQIALVFGAGMLVAGLILLIVYGVRSYRNKAEQEVRSENLFLDTAARLGLSIEEREELTALLSHQNVPEPHTIFQSLPLFEQAVDAEVNRLLRGGLQVNADGPEEKLISDLRKKLGFAHLPLEHPLVSTRNIALGQVGSIFGREGNKPLLNKVSVVDNNSFFFTVEFDVEKEDHYRIGPGTALRFVFARQNDGLYGVQVKVANANEAGAIDFFHTLELRRNQLRQYVRIETNLPLRFRLLSTKDPDKSEIQRGLLVTTRMSDVSGGGLSFLHEQSLRLGDLISISFDLPGQGFAGITGKIVHLALREGKNGQLFKHHVQFVNIEQRKREGIIKYVFEKERQLSQWR